jgi:hypothetical protein
MLFGLNVHEIYNYIKFISSYNDFKINTVNINFNKKLDLIILAGGKGSRIKNFTRLIPKALIKFDNKPILKYIINIFLILMLSEM